MQPAVELKVCTDMSLLVAHFDDNVVSDSADMLSALRVAL